MYWFKKKYDLATLAETQNIEMEFGMVYYILIPSLYNSLYVMIITVQYVSVLCDFHGYIAVVL